jgi:hypothetical protein
MQTVIAAIAVLLGALTVPAGAQTLTLYDGFQDVGFDPSRWRGYEHMLFMMDWSGGIVFPNSIRDEREVLRSSPAPAWNLESRRELAGGRARLALTTVGITWDSDWTPGRGRLGLRLSDPELAGRPSAIRAMQAQVSVVSGAVPTTCAYPRRVGPETAGIHAVFVNDGASTGGKDRTGDIVASLVVSPRSDGSTSMSASLGRCMNAACSWIRSTAAATYGLSGRAGEPHLLTLRWDPDRDRVLGIVSTGGESERAWLSYPTTGTSLPAVGFVYDLRVDITAGACGGPMAERDHVGSWIDARFDRVRIATDTAD